MAKTINFPKYEFSKDTTDYPFKRFTFPRPMPTIEQFEKGVRINDVYNIRVAIQDKCENLIYDSIYEIAHEQGIDELIVIDKEFIITALMNELKRRNGNG